MFGCISIRCVFCGALNAFELHNPRPRDGRGSGSSTIRVGEAGPNLAARPLAAKCCSYGHLIRFDRPVIVSEKDFEATVLKAGVPVLVDFYADWCGTCQRLDAPIERLARMRLGTILVVKINVQAARRLAQRYEVRTLPTLLVFRHGREVSRRAGALRTAELEELVDEA